MGDGLFAGRGVIGAPNLLREGKVSQGRDNQFYHHTWSALQARLKAVSRSVGELARELLDSAREPPMRRDHCKRRVSGNIDG